MGFQSAVAVVQDSRRVLVAQFGFEMVEAALMAAGKRVVVVEEGEVRDDLVRDLLEILLLTQMCLPYGQSNTSACG